MSFTADGTRALMVENTGRCRWFNLPAGDIPSEFKIEADGTRTDEGLMSADGSVFLNYEQRWYFARDGVTGKVIRSALPNASSSRVGLSADGRRSAALRWDVTKDPPHIVEIMNVATEAKIAAVPIPKQKGTPFPVYSSGKIILIKKNCGLI